MVIIIHKKTNTKWFYIIFAGLRETKKKKKQWASIIITVDDRPSPLHNYHPHSKPNVTVVTFHHPFNGVDLLFIYCYHYSLNLRPFILSSHPLHFCEGGSSAFTPFCLRLDAVCCRYLGILILVLGIPCLVPLCDCAPSVGAVFFDLLGFSSHRQWTASPLLLLILSRRRPPPPPPRRSAVRRLGIISSTCRLRLPTISTLWANILPASFVEFCSVFYVHICVFSHASVCVQL